MRHCIILHLYYQDLWDEFSSYIQSLLGEDVDLIVTVTESQEVPKQVSDMATLVIKVPNRGMDIGPFLLAYQQVRGKYKTITKLHTKKSLHTPHIGDNWRRGLYIPLLTFYKELVDNLLKIEEPSMVGVDSFILQEESDPGRSATELQTYIQTICNTLGIHSRGSFIAGTMFIVNNAYMEKYFSDENINSIYKMFPEGYIRDETPAHAMERVFGYIATQNNFLVL